MAIVVRSRLRPEIRASTNSTMPIGGCSRPIIRFSTITRPKWIGSMPSVLAIGSRMGTRMGMAAVGSRKQPTKSISRLASSRNTHGSWVKASTQAAMSVVTPVTVSIQPKIAAAATISSTVLVVSMVSRKTLMNIFHDSVRYQAKPRILAHAQTTTAPYHDLNAGRVRSFGGIKLAGGNAADQQLRRHDGQQRLEVEQLVEHEK